jgi:hypothetical protein
MRQVRALRYGFVAYFLGTLVLCVVAFVLGKVTFCSKRYIFPWNLKLEEFFRMEQTMLSEAKNGDREAIRSLLWMGQIVDTERAEYHEDILLGLLEGVGDEYFKDLVSREPYSIREGVAMNMSACLGLEEGVVARSVVEEAKAKYPRTREYLKTYWPRRRVEP